MVGAVRDGNTAAKIAKLLCSRSIGPDIVVLNRVPPPSRTLDLDPVADIPRNDVPRLGNRAPDRILFRSDQPHSPGAVGQGVDPVRLRADEVSLDLIPERRGVAYRDAAEGVPGNHVSSACRQPSDQIVRRLVDQDAHLAVP